jgi:predicted transcriptional regulator of viral defense system
MLTGPEKLLTIAKRRGYVTASAAARAGVHSQALTRLVADGALERVSPGRYRLTSAERTEQHGLVVAAAAAPDGVICLLSALTVHEIGSQLPTEVWLAVERGQRPPKIANLALRVVRFSGPAFREGIEVHRLEGQRVRVYSVAKTLADLFKARHQVGLDVVLEALKESWRNRRFNMPDLERAARVCRVERVIRPYLEAITT